MRKTMLAALAAMIVMAAPAPGIAQDTPVSGQQGQDPDDGDPSPEDISAMMRTLFTVEPLTAEQRARLPQAGAVINRMMPPGTMQQVMGGMFDKMLGPMAALGADADSAHVATELGVEDDAFALGDEDAERIATILDPARKERHELEMAAVQRTMSATMTTMEPGMRKGMSEAYAATFTASELTDIERFFATPSGAAFASKSYALASDPRIMSAALESMPAMMAQMKAMEVETKAAVARLPARRGYADLSAAQRAEIARLTGLGQDAIREGMGRAAAAREETSAEDAQD